MSDSNSDTESESQRLLDNSIPSKILNNNCHSNQPIVNGIELSNLSLQAVYGADS